MRPRVLMVGPGDGVVGGIATVVQTVVPLLEEEVDLLYVPTTQQRPHKGDAGKITRRNVASIFGQYGRYLAALRRFRPHLIHLHSSQQRGWLKDTFYVWVAKVLGCQVVLHIHAADFDQLYGQRSRAEQYYTRTVMRRANVVIAVSEQWRERLGQIVSPEDVITFRNCVAVGNGTKPAPAHPQTRVQMLFLGSIGPRKGVFDLLRAADLLGARGAAFDLWIAGYEERSGDTDRAKEQLATSRLQDSCHLVGIVQGAEKARLLHEADIFVLPSYNEGLPIAILEAMAAGLAIVATPVGGIAEVVHDGDNGFLVEPGDVDALAEKLSILANDRELRQAMGRRSRRIAERELDVIPYTRRLVSLYEALALRDLA